MTASLPAQPLSPLDGRYRAAVAGLADYLSEAGLNRARVEGEVEWLIALTDRFGVRRTDRRFWPLSDAIHAEWRRIAPQDAAILDYSRFENR